MTRIQLIWAFFNVLGRRSPNAMLGTSSDYLDDSTNVNLEEPDLHRVLLRRRGQKVGLADVTTKVTKQLTDTGNLLEKQRGLHENTLKPGKQETVLSRPTTEIFDQVKKSTPKKNADDGGRILKSKVAIKSSGGNVGGKNGVTRGPFGIFRSIFNMFSSGKKQEIVKSDNVAPPTIKEPNSNIKGVLNKSQSPFPAGSEKQKRIGTLHITNTTRTLKGGMIDDDQDAVIIKRTDKYMAIGSQNLDAKNKLFKTLQKCVHRAPLSEKERSRKEENELNIKHTKGLDGKAGSVEKSSIRLTEKDVLRSVNTVMTGPDSFASVKAIPIKRISDTSLNNLKDNPPILRKQFGKTTSTSLNQSKASKYTNVLSKIFQPKVQNDHGRDRKPSSITKVATNNKEAITGSIANAKQRLAGQNAPSPQVKYLSPDLLAEHKKKLRVLKSEPFAVLESKSLPAFEKLKDTSRNFPDKVVQELKKIAVESTQKSIPRVEILKEKRKGIISFFKTKTEKGVDMVFSKDDKGNVPKFEFPRRLDRTKYHKGQELGIKEMPIISMHIVSEKSNSTNISTARSNILTLKKQLSGAALVAKKTGGKVPTTFVPYTLKNKLKPGLPVEVYKSGNKTAKHSVKKNIQKGYFKLLPTAKAEYLLESIGMKGANTTEKSTSVIKVTKTLDTSNNNLMNIKKTNIIKNAIIRSKHVGENQVKGTSIKVPAATLENLSTKVNNTKEKSSFVPEAKKILATLDKKLTNNIDVSTARGLLIKLSNETRQQKAEAPKQTGVAENISTNIKKVGIKNIKNAMRQSAGLNSETKEENRIDVSGKVFTVKHPGNKTTMVARETGDRKLAMEKNLKNAQTKKQKDDITTTTKIEPVTKKTLITVGSSGKLESLLSGKTRAPSTANLENSKTSPVFIMRKEKELGQSPPYLQFQKTNETSNIFSEGPLVNTLANKVVDRRLKVSQNMRKKYETPNTMIKKLTDVKMPNGQKQVAKKTVVPITNTFFAEPANKELPNLYKILNKLNKIKKEVTQNPSSILDRMLTLRKTEATRVQGQENHIKIEGHRMKGHTKGITKAELSEKIPTENKPPFSLESVLVRMRPKHDEEARKSPSVTGVTSPEAKSVLTQNSGNGETESKKVINTSIVNTRIPKKKPILQTKAAVTNRGQQLPRFVLKTIQGSENEITAKLRSPGKTLELRTIPVIAHKELPAFRERLGEPKEAPQIMRLVPTKVFPRIEPGDEFLPEDTGTSEEKPLQIELLGFQALEGERSVSNDRKVKHEDARWTEDKARFRKKSIAFNTETKAARVHVGQPGSEKSIETSARLYEVKHKKREPETVLTAFDETGINYEMPMAIEEEGPLQESYQLLRKLIFDAPGSTARKITDDAGSNGAYIRHNTRFAYEPTVAFQENLDRDRFIGVQKGEPIVEPSLDNIPTTERIDYFGTQWDFGSATDNTNRFGIEANAASDDYTTLPFRTTFDYDTLAVPKSIVDKTEDHERKVEKYGKDSIEEHNMYKKLADLHATAIPDEPFTKTQDIEASFADILLKEMSTYYGSVAYLERFSSTFLPGPSATSRGIQVEPATINMMDSEESTSCINQKPEATITHDTLAQQQVYNKILKQIDATQEAQPSPEVNVISTEETETTGGSDKKFALDNHNPPHLSLSKDSHQPNRDSLDEYERLEANTIDLANELRYENVLKNLPDNAYTKRNKEDFYDEELTKPGIIKDEVSDTYQTLRWANDFFKGRKRGNKIAVLGNYMNSAIKKYASQVTRGNVDSALEQEDPDQSKSVQFEPKAPRVEDVITAFW